MAEKAAQDPAPWAKKMPTVCEKSRCPNQAECFSQNVATLLLMGNVCSRACRYCNIDSGQPLALDEREPEKVVQVIRAMRLEYIVLTMVTRDDLADGGATHLLSVVQALRESEHLPKQLRIELLMSDFGGDVHAWQRMADSPLDVVSHNMETVKENFAHIRPQGDYQISLNLLSYLRQKSDQTLRRKIVKSGFMLGLGESEKQVIGLLHDMKNAGVEVITIGQYLRPSKQPGLLHAEYVDPQLFLDYEYRARQMGFVDVFSGPFVRSSYLADRLRPLLQS